MPRKRSLIPALPASSRVLDLLLIAVGVFLIVSWFFDGDAGLLGFGIACVAIGALLLASDLLSSRRDEESEER
jgi:hypothetical protein